MQFPPELEERVCRAIHHSTQPLDKLVNAVYEGLRPPAPPASSQNP